MEEFVQTIVYQPENRQNRDTSLQGETLSPQRDSDVDQYADAPEAPYRYLGNYGNVSQSPGSTHTDEDYALPPPLRVSRTNTTNPSGSGRGRLLQQAGNFSPQPVPGAEGTISQVTRAVGNLEISAPFPRELVQAEVQATGLDGGSQYLGRLFLENRPVEGKYVMVPCSGQGPVLGVYFEGK